MTAVANPSGLSQITRPAWGINSPAAFNAMNHDEAARMLMPRKSVQRSNSSSSISSTSSNSSTATVLQTAQPPNGVAMSTSADPSWNTPATRRKAQRTGPWPAGKAEAVSGTTMAGPRSVLASGVNASAALNSIIPSPVLPSQQIAQNGTQHANGLRGMTPGGEGNPVLYLLSLNATFERKTITVPFQPDCIRIGRQTNAKTVPTPANGFFDSKVLSRQHAEIWADRNGKVWIRDVKSSNGTFVNSVRLSPENKESEPHELQTQDQLELGIDIVSEDQKTVVHHKVAAKVEHAGFLGSSNNVMDMNFGDLDPANGSLLMSNHNGLAIRGRPGSQGSVGSSVRGAPSIAGSQLGMANGHRPMAYWLTPVTTEQIAKRIQHEMRSARLQAADLGHADNFFGSLLTNSDVKDAENSMPVSKPQVNGAAIPFRTNSQTRFSDPPAPPPQQPLPEKPDVARSFGYEPSSAASKRNSADRGHAMPGPAAMKSDASSQIVTLVEALATARRDVEEQKARMRDLEEMLAQERQAREAAEELARLLESRSAQAEAASTQVSISEPGSAAANDHNQDPTSVTAMDGKRLIDAEAIAESSRAMERRLEALLDELRSTKEQCDEYRVQAEKAENARASDRQTLAQMVEQIRLQDMQHQSDASEAADHVRTKDMLHGGSEAMSAVLAPILGTSGVANGSAHKSPLRGESRNVSRSTNSTPRTSTGTGTGTGTMSQQQHARLAYQSAPYASMIGVVLIGMGLMAYINGWQPPKVER